jgi:sulfite exporter TauE/SafE
MSGYRENESLYRRFFPADRWRLSYIAVGLGFGLLPISFARLVGGGSLIECVVEATLGVVLLAYGLRTY